MRNDYSTSVSSALSLLLLLGTSSSHAACSGNSTTILPAPTLGGFYTEASALNAAGQFTGYSYDAGNLAARAFVADSSTIADLGTLGGTYASGTAINSSGQIAGVGSINEFFELRAFVSDGGSLIDLGTLGGTYSSATAINDAGQVTGDSLIAGDAAYEAFLYENGVMSGLGTLGGSSSFAAALNQAGMVAGSSYTEFDLETHAFLYANGSMTDLGTLGGDYSAAFALNETPTVVGEASLPNWELHAFSYQGGVMTDLGTLGGTYSTAWAINTNGWIIGESGNADDAEIHGFVSVGGNMIDLGTLGGDYSYPAAINNLGQIVGDSALSNGTAHAFLWQDGSMVDLNSLIPANSGWELVTADFINDAGRIVGFGYFNNALRVYVLDAGGTPNQAPVAGAPASYTTDCQTPVTLDGSASMDPDGDTLTYEWSEGAMVLGTESSLTASFSLGVHNVILKVTDPCGESSQTSVQVMVVDTEAPIIESAPTALTISAGANCTAAVPDITSEVIGSDNCTAANQLTVTQSPTAGTVLTSGQHDITVTVTDASGNQTATTVVLQIVDNTAPVIASVRSSPEVLSPPNNRLVPVTLTVVAADNCDPTPVSQIESITANVPVAAGDIQITGSLTANLAATKNPTGGDRVYTITVRCTDATGNSSTATTTVTVPKNGGKGNGPKNK